MVSCTPARDLPTAEPGLPLPGLTAEEKARFEEGRAAFDRDFTFEEGLGPLFNQRRCSSCHDLPTLGGSGVELIRKATRYVDGRCDLLDAVGGDNFQAQTSPGLAALGVTHEPLPPEANGVTAMQAPPLYGLGLVEAIPEEAISRREDPEDRDGDGISGRAPRASNGALLRFGQKGDSPTLRHFISGALNAELGITTPIHPTEPTVNGHPLPDGIDAAPDPEIDDRGLDRLVDYVRFLAPPARRVAETSVEAREVSRGEAAFDRVGCSGCHVPHMTTGPATDSVFDRQTVALYSDLLLHDMGNELADVCGPSASPSELRTAPLLGLRFRSAYLHDASARSLQRVVERHGGEAAPARDRFLGLSPDARAAVFRFLESL